VYPTARKDSICHGTQLSVWVNANRWTGSRTRRGDAIKATTKVNGGKNPCISPLTSPSPQNNDVVGIYT
jgi:hypothetical protein